MSIFENIDLSSLNIGSEEQLQTSLTTLNNYTPSPKGIYTYSTETTDSGTTKLNYYLPNETIILCDTSKVTAVTSNLTSITEGYKVTSTGLVQISYTEKTPISII